MQNPQPLKPDEIILIQHLSSSTSTILSRTLATPLNVIRFNQQVKNCDPLDASISIYDRSGVLGFFKGYSLDVSIVVPHTLVKFYVCDMFQRFFYNTSLVDELTSQEDDEDESFWKSLFTTMVATTTSSILFYPFEIIQTRIATGKDESIFSCIKNIFNTDGIWGFFNGVSAGICGIAIYSMVANVTFEFFKNYILRRRVPVVWESIVLGTCTSVLANTCMYPLDTVKRRMQVDNNYKNFVDCTERLIEEEGISSLFAGIGTHLLKTFFYAMLQLTVSEMLRMEMIAKITGVDVDDDEI